MTRGNVRRARNCRTTLQQHGTTGAFPRLGKGL